MCGHLVRQAVELLRRQNSSVQAHPNSHVYSQLSSLVDFDGYYLESDPCLVCNDPEVPFTVSGAGLSVSVCLFRNGTCTLSGVHLRDGRHWPP